VASDTGWLIVAMIYTGGHHPHPKDGSAQEVGARVHCWPNGNLLSALRSGTCPEATAG